VSYLSYIMMYPRYAVLYSDSSDRGRFNASQFGSVFDQNTSSMITMTSQDFEQYGMGAARYMSQVMGSWVLPSG
jgi:hypothetical protein